MKTIQLLLVVMSLGLATGCKKDSKLTLEISSIVQENDDITYTCEVHAPQFKYDRVLDKGIIWGTSPDLAATGTRITHGSSDGKYSGTIPDISFDETYYVQAYALYYGKEYLSEIKTLNTGTGWSILKNFPEIDGFLRTVAVSPNGAVHVAGTEGTHYYSTDEGNNWNKIYHPDDKSLTEMKFIDEDVILMRADNIIRKTTDGGMTWSDIPFPDTYNVRSVFFYDATTFFCSIFDSIYTTTNAGTTWTSAYAPTGYSDGPQCIQFLSPTEGYAVSYKGYTMKTTDGGQSWTTLTASQLYHYGVMQLWFTDENTAYLGAFGYIYQSTDGGVSWSLILDSVDYYRILEIDFCNNQAGAIATRDGTILQTTDGGTTWNIGLEQAGAEIHDVEMFDATLGYAILGNKTVLRFDH